MFFIACSYYLGYTFHMATDKPKVILVMEDDLITRIDDFRYENRIPSRAEAIRRLITESLERYQGQPQKKSTE